VDPGAALPGSSRAPLGSNWRLRIPDEIASTQTYDNGVYLEVFMNWELAAIWLMTRSQVLDWIAGQGFEGTAEQIFYKLLIFKIGAGCVGPALVSNAEGTCLGRSGPSHRPKGLTAPAITSVYKIVSSHTHEGQATWINVDDKRLLSPGPKSAFVEIVSAQIDGATTKKLGLPANLWI
jgi:hypothetical protein